MTEKYTPTKGDYIDLKGKKYLPARRRVQWFRGDHPDWTINTSVVDMDFSAGYAVIRAEVLDDTGRLIASGMKTETKAGFGDFVEKAETGAIARAVAIAGYGTEDALDLDEGERIADSPVARRNDAPDGRVPASRPAAPPDKREQLARLMNDRHISVAALERVMDRIGIAKGSHATDEQLDEVMVVLASGGELLPEPPPSDPDQYEAWFKRQPSEERARLRAKGEAPEDMRRRKEIQPEPTQLEVSM